MRDIVRTIYGLRVESDSTGIQIYQEDQRRGGCVTVSPDEVELLCALLREQAANNGFVPVPQP